MSEHDQDSTHTDGAGTVIRRVAASLVLARPAAADNCDIFINPEDCQNTGWTIGTIATLAGGVAVATIATAAGSRNGGGAERREPTTPLSPAGSPMASRDRRERRWTPEDVEIQPTSDPSTIEIQPPDGDVRGQPPMPIPLPGRA
ncbi:MAG: hypothetical protein ACT4NY_12685 [Pseudonocardiales bacterium]